MHHKKLTYMLTMKHQATHLSKKGSPYSIIERRVPELIPVLCSQPVGDVSHKPGGRLPLLSARPAVTPATVKRAATNFAAPMILNCVSEHARLLTVGVLERLFLLARLRDDLDSSAGERANVTSVAVEHANRERKVLALVRVGDVERLSRTVVLTIAQTSLSKQSMQT